MFQSLHSDLAKASAPTPQEQRAKLHLPGRGQPPPRRLRGGAAGALATLARRLDAERARRALA